MARPARGNPTYSEKLVPLCLPKIPTWSHLGYNPNLRSYSPATKHVNHGKTKPADIIQLNKHIYIGTSRALKGERANSYTCNVEIGQDSVILNRDVPKSEQNFSHLHRHI
jgi:hypothetical protein